MRQGGHIGYTLLGKVADALRLVYNGCTGAWSRYPVKAIGPLGLEMRARSACYRPSKSCDHAGAPQSTTERHGRPHALPRTALP